MASGSGYGSPSGRLAFHCVSDARYFLGAVGMINSLRLHGHTEPVFLLDCGLSATQRELLEPHATLVPAPRGEPPQLLKAVAPLAHPADVAVLIDVDMIVTRPLDELVDRAARGGIVACANETQRFFPDWGELLGLGETRRGAYVSSGLVALGGAPGAEALRLLDAKRDLVDFELTFWGRNVEGYPFLYADQDLLNAILHARTDPDAVVTLESRMAATPPFRGLRLRDPKRLRCAFPDGAEPLVLHYYSRKPWLEPVYQGIYSRLLARLLHGDDVAIRVPEAELPPWLRAGPRARLARRWIDARGWAGWQLRERLPRGAVRKVDEARRRRQARRG